MHCSCAPFVVCMYALFMFCAVSLMCVYVMLYSFTWPFNDMW